MKFITLLAWIFGIYSTILFIGRIYFKLTYSLIDKMQDHLVNGGIKLYPLRIPVAVSVICWAWILTN